MKGPSPRRLLLVTPGFPADEQDSLCIPPIQLMLPAIKARYPNLEVTVLALHYPSERRSYRWQDIEVMGLGGANRRWPFRLIDLVRTRRIAEKLHADRPFSHIHALWLSDAALVASSIARRWSCPISVTAMGQDVLPTNRYLHLLAQRPIRLVAISDRAGIILEQSIGRKPDAVIQWGIDPTPETLPGWGNRSIDLLGVGSLIELKGWARLLEVMQQLSKRGAPHRVILVGDGPLRTPLEAEAKHRGLVEHLTFTGELPRSEVLRLMENSRILLHPSRFEGQGFVFSEALSRGMSIVSGPVGTAAPSSRWRVVEPDEYASECFDLMQHPPSTSSLVPHPLKDTVTAYGTIWGLDP